MKELSDEVLRKIGRNVLLFQQIERLLKFVVTNHRADGTTIDFVERHQKRAGKIQARTMGELIKQYGGEVSHAGELTKEQKEVTQAWMSYTFTIASNNDFMESQRSDLELMVRERNDLVHHFLPRWHPDSLEHMTAASAYLDQQYEKVLPMFEHLKSVAKSMQQAQETLAAFLASNEGERLLELDWLQNSPLVALLREVATQKARPDGWTNLADAGRLARIHESDEGAHMKERYGHSTLKRLLIASELFDVLDESLPNGGFRTLYRVKVH
ncbi:hypothetical protein SAMN05216404_106235 [Nitrosospira multiformis]|uniref:OST-HTH/LOTUS domain-containing protein n=1 Tax=Nitrosospira multiformis TaxID=1231 RepID=A0A1H8J173_9PROT|nr:OST-HTH/LOTUS domain-containing protein [Nitrosospira multiformis]SEN73718.1 hypothetical protein SAMN05216404_106235 [Nitrosospira multiformis]